MEPRIVSDRLKLMFLLLVCAQVAHSVEEYVLRLWEVWAPARFLTAMVSASNPGFGFLVINIGLLLLGFSCYFVVVRPGRPSARAWIWFWVVLEFVNGLVHTLWAVTSGSYRPGLLTAVPFLVLVPILLRQLLTSTRAPGPRPTPV